MSLTRVYAVRGGFPGRRRSLCVRASRVSWACWPRTGGQATDWAGGGDITDRPAGLELMSCCFAMPDRGHRRYRLGGQSALDSWRLTISLRSGHEVPQR